MTSKPLIPLLAVALLAGCGSERADRAGGEKPVKAKVLVMANAQYFPDELAAFGEAVERVSDGRLRLKWINEYGAGRDGNPEVNVVRDVSAGKADLGWAATRIFDELGVSAFNPLHAPMLIDSYELEQRVLSDGLLDPMLDSLGEIGLRGVGVLPGPLRRPFGKRPLRALADWRGKSIGSSGGDQVGMALRAGGGGCHPAGARAVARAGARRAGTGLPLPPPDRRGVAGPGRRAAGSVPPGLRPPRAGCCREPYNGANPGARRGWRQRRHGAVSEGRQRPGRDDPAGHVPDRAHAR